MVRCKGLREKGVTRGPIELYRKSVSNKPLQLVANLLHLDERKSDLSRSRSEWCSSAFAWFFLSVSYLEILLPCAGYQYWKIGCTRACTRRSLADSHNKPPDSMWVLPKSQVQLCAGTKPTKQFKFSILNSVINNITNCKVEGVAKRLERTDYDLLIGERSLSHSSWEYHSSSLWRITLNRVFWQTSYLYSTL